jgi:hypothetical protein
MSCSKEVFVSPDRTTLAFDVKGSRLRLSFLPVSSGQPVKLNLGHYEYRSFDQAELGELGSLPRAGVAMDNVAGFVGRRLLFKLVSWRDGYDS